MEIKLRITEEMRRRYTERRARDAEELAASLEAGETCVLARIGHQLLGNAATYGYESLANLGRNMEEAASRESLADGEDCLFQLKAWVQDQAYGMGEDG